MTVFIFGDCCPNCNTIISVRNCSGDYVGNLGYGDNDIDFGILDNDIIIWKPVNFSCIE